MGFTTTVGTRAQQLVVWLLGAAGAMLVLMTPLAAAPPAHAGPLAPCSAPISDAELQSLQLAAEHRLWIVRQLADSLPGAVLLYEAQRQAQGGVYNGLADIVISYDYQLIADLAVVDDNGTPRDYATSLGAVMGQALTTEEYMYTFAAALGTPDELTLHFAMIDLQAAWADLQLGAVTQQLTAGSAACNISLDACVLVAPADAEAVLGAPDPRGLPPTEGLPQPPPGLVEGSACDYRTALGPNVSGGPGGVLTVLVGRFTDTGTAHLGMQQLIQALNSSTQPVTQAAVSGLGDEAISASATLPAPISGGQLAALFVRKGSVVFVLVAAVDADGAPAGLVARVQNLGEKVVGKLN